MKRALITGITGQDGSYLAELLVQKRYSVYGLTRDSEKEYPNLSAIKDCVTLLEGDLTDFDSVKSAVQTAHPDEVYNLGAITFAGSNLSLDIAEVTGLGAIRLLEAVRQCAPTARVFQASSAEIFGRQDRFPTSEHSPHNPVSMYGIAKKFAYDATIHYRMRHGLFACNGILFNHESERRGAEFVTRKITQGVARIKLGIDKEIVLGNLDSMRDWGYAPEYMDASWRMLQHETASDLVIATGESHSVREFLIEAFKAAGISDWEKHVRTEQRFMRPADIPRTAGDARRSEKLLGWRAKTTFRDLVDRMVKHDIRLLS